MTIQTTARRALRLAAAQALGLIVGLEVETPGDWEVEPRSAPNAKLRTPDERKQSTDRGQAKFTTTVSLEILLTVVSNSGEGAQDALDDLMLRVENALLGNVAMVSLVQQFATISSSTVISAEGKQHVGRADMRVDCEVYEHFDPTEIDPDSFPPLQQVSLHVDTVRRSMRAAPTPAATSRKPSPPAPRTSGPDGRDEGALQINLPQA
jgi:hypothetical protein